MFGFFKRKIERKLPGTFIPAMTETEAAIYRAAQVEMFRRNDAMGDVITNIRFAERKNKRRNQSANIVRG